MEVNFEAYKDKYQLQLDLTKTLEEKEKEVDRLAAENKVLEEKVAELEKLTIPDKEEKVEAPSGEFTQMSRGALIKRCVEAESSAVEMATFSFHSVVAQVQILNLGVELVLVGLDECKVVRDGAILFPIYAPEETPGA
jgi:hypothetical protein